MEPYQVRLEAIKTRVQALIRSLKEAQEYDKQRLSRELHVVTSRFINDMHKYMDKISVEEVLEFTNLQLEADILTSATPPFTSTTKSTSVKLPQLSLPQFNGNILKWSEFWDRFQATIDAQPLGDADKLAYLQVSLGQEAAAAIEGLDTTNSNYPIAVEILKERYGKRGIVVDAHYKAMQSMNSCENSPRECMNTFNELERHLRVLKGLGEDTNHNNLRTIILGKFPTEVIYELSTKVKLEEESVDTIRKLLGNQITARMATIKTPTFTTEVLMQRTTDKVNHPSRGRKQAGKRKHQVLLTSEPPNKRMRIRPCIFCAQNHYNDLCPKSLKERTSLLKGKCYKCFSSSHLIKNCQDKRKCRHCCGNHNSALCRKLIKEKHSGKNEPLRTSTHLGNDGRALLQTAIIEIKGKNGISKYRALLDTGSQRSYITEKAAKKLGIIQKEDNCLTIYTFGSRLPSEVVSPLVEVDVICRKGSVPINLNVMSYITDRVDIPPPSLLTSLTKRIREQLADDGSLGTKVDLLIGNDYYHTFVEQDKLQYGKYLYLIESNFGLIWSGHHDDRNENEIQHMYIVTHVQGEPTQLTNYNLDLPLQGRELHRLWDLETIGIMDCPKKSRDDEAVENFNKTVQCYDGRYWIKWPWCRAPSALTDNFGLAYGRLKGLYNRMDAKTLLKYDKVLRDQMNSGVIEEVKGAMNTGHAIHYLPHHYVVKEDKLRLVYDASSKKKGQFSLNECVYRGPLLLENLVGLIIRMRTHRYGMVADVEKAFLQIGIQEPDRDVTRFLWLKDIQNGPTEGNLLHLRFCRVPFGIGCSPFILAVTLKYHLQRTESPICERILKDIYVDNLVTGANTTEECVKLYKETNHVFNMISMNMRQWHTNNADMIEVVPEAKRGEGLYNVPLLGIDWNTRNDTLSLRTSLKNVQSPLNRRKLLALVASIFDPCGYASPLLVGARLLVQKTWELKLGWDETFPPQLDDEYEEVTKQLEHISNIELPRWFGGSRSSEGVSQIEFHCFTDASENCYAAVVYIRIERSPNDITTSLVMSKSRLAPVKNKHMNTIPRLELLGVLIGCRLLNYVQDNLQIGNRKKILWTDSQIVLHWIKSKRVLPPFVANRMVEINRNKDIEFKYVSSENNPADLATRHCKGKLSETRWFTGPQYLEKDQKEWPNSFVAAGEGLRLASEEDGEAESEANEVPFHLQYDKIREIQKSNFSKEVEGKITDMARELRIFKDDDGLLRCEGRFKNADLTHGQKYPILLPRESEFTWSVIENTHRSNYHVGVTHTLALVRRRFWVPKARSLVQKVLKRCIQCRKYGGGPYKMPHMPPLPSERVTYSAPFTYTGMDYLGPLMTIEGEKRWVCLFTCLAVRVVHLEVVNSLSTEECNLAVRRFTATRGLPAVITSDNATQFKLMAEVLTNKYCIENNITWKFIPELAPWFGGFYERLVGLVKHCMKRTLDKHLLNDQQLRTITKEIEAVLNTRPLTYVSRDNEDILTPADFLRVGGTLVTSMVDNDLPPLGSEIKGRLIEGWKRGQVVLREYVKMFQQQYLPLLREKLSKRKVTRAGTDKIPKVGDIVQIKDEGIRANWKVGKISETVKGTDGQIRVARVRVGDKEFTRSVGHLYPLEIELEIEGSEEEGKNEGVEIVALRERSAGRREASETARKKITEWTKLLVARCEDRVGKPN